MDCSLSGSSAHGICQARVLEWVAIASSMMFLIHVQRTSQFSAAGFDVAWMVLLWEVVHV